MNTLKKNLPLEIALVSFVLAIYLSFGAFGSQHVALADGASVVLTPIASQTVTQGDLATFIASASVDDADVAIAYSLSGAPW